MTIQHQRLTIYQDDDVTPLSGSPTCTTDPAGTRPYMQRVLEQGESEVDFINGSSTIGVVNAVVLDKRTVATDQQTGWFTALLASSGGVNQLTGRRCLIEQQGPTGAWYVVINGVIGDITMVEETIVEYTIEVKDMRQREKKVPLFNISGGQLSLFPMGLSVPYGTITTAAGDTPLVPVTRGVRAKFARDPGIAFNGGSLIVSYSGVAVVQDMGKHPMPDYDTQQKIVDATYAREMFDSVGNSLGYRFEWAIVRWRPWIDNNDTDIGWTTLQAPPTAGISYFSNYAACVTFSHGGPIPFDVNQRFKPWVTFSSLAGNWSDLPTDGEDIEVQVLYCGPPTEELPIIFEKNFGQLLKDIYDGMYSSEAPKIKYNASAMSDFIANTPLARVWITEPAEDLAQWVEDNIYKPLGYAPALNENGEIVPIKYEIPDASVSLTQLDDTNVSAATWKHQFSDVVNKVVFTYHRDTTNPTKNPLPPSSAFIQKVLVTREVQIIDVNAPSASLIGPKAVEFSPVTVRSIGVNGQNTPLNGDSHDELGTQLARQRAKVLFDRFNFGAQRIDLTALRLDPAVSDIKVGDWVTLATSYLPDYGSHKRGMDRIGQVVRIQDVSPIERKLQVVDAGPSGTPLGLPTVGTLVEAGGRIDVPITALPAGADVRVDFFVGPVAPPTSSGDWTFAGRRTGTGTIITPPVPVGVDVWIRARSEAIGKRPSAWTTPISITTVLEPIVKDAWLEIIDSHNPIVHWTPDIDSYGYRIWWQTWQDGDIPGVFNDHIDVNASVGIAELPITMRLRYYENILVAIDPVAQWPIPNS